MPLELKDIEIPLADLRKVLAELQKTNEVLNLEQLLTILIAMYRPRRDTQLAIGDGIVSPLREKEVRSERQKK